MAITCKQEIINTISWDRDGKPTGKEVKYLVSGAIGSTTESGESQALAAVKKTAPVTFSDLALSKFSLDQNKGGGTYVITVAYESSNAQDISLVINNADSAKYSFDVNTGGSMQITNSLKTVKRYGTAPDLEGAINCNGDNVAGVSRRVPVSTFSETHRLRSTKVTTTYKKNLNTLSATINNEKFRGYSQGEVMFLGASGQQRDDGDWDITFKFAVSPNRYNFSVGKITVKEKYGWDYMWVKYVKDVAADGKSRINKPVGVYIERIYYISSFRNLGIGV